MSAVASPRSARESITTLLLLLGGGQVGLEAVGVVSGRMSVGMSLGFFPPQRNDVLFLETSPRVATFYLLQPCLHSEDRDIRCRRTAKSHGRKQRPFLYEGGIFPLPRPPSFPRGRGYPAPSPSLVPPGVGLSRSLALPRSLEGAALGFWDVHRNRKSPVGRSKKPLLT